MGRNSFYILNCGFTFSTLNFKFSPYSYALVTWPLTSTKDYVRKNILFMQNKANFKKVKLNVTKVLTKDYVQMDTWSIRKTKPIKANSKPIKANIMLKQSQFKPKQTQFQRLKNIRMKGIFYLTYIHRAAMYIVLILYLEIQN